MKRQSIKTLLPAAMVFAAGAASVAFAVISFVQSRPSVVIAVGDIAGCEGRRMHGATSTLVDGIDGTVLVLGDIAYVSGSRQEFTDCFDPEWGRHRSRIHPVPGNHEYRTPGAEAYFWYFGEAAGEPGKGYYSFDVGRWHIVALNSNCGDGWEPDGCRSGSAQEQWLRADLTAHPAACTLAYFHHQLFSSSNYSDDLTMLELWETLYEFGIDIVLVGHEHFYERFAAQDPFGQTDPRGIRQFIVGTGGIDHGPLDARVRNSEVVDNQTYGVLKLTLAASSYGWEFIPIEGSTFRDAGQDTCTDGPNSAAEFRATTDDVVLADAPSAYWRLSEAEGSTAFDAVGAVNGTYDGVQLQAQGLRRTEESRAAEFDGVNGRIVVGDVFDFADRRPFSFEVSVFPLSVDDHYRRIVSKDAYAAPANRGWALTHHKDGLTFIRYDGNGVGNQATAPALPLNEWSHVMGIYDGMTMRIFRNGVRVASSASAVNLPELSAPFTIGASSAGADFFHGRVTDVAIYDYALSPVQLRWHAFAARTFRPSTAVRSPDEHRP